MQIRPGRRLPALVTGGGAFALAGFAVAANRFPVDAARRGSGASDDAELVAFRVAHDDGAAADVVDLPRHAGVGPAQPLHVLADQLLAFLAADLAPGHPDVEVDPVLGGLALGHALEVDPGPLARRVNPEACAPNSDSGIPAAWPN